jgi:hypothetical protein
MGFATASYSLFHAETGRAVGVLILFGKGWNGNAPAFP